jgi:hypothetical protein
LVDGINERRDLGARADEACAQLRKTQGVDIKSCPDKTAELNITPVELAVDILSLFIP